MLDTISLIFIVFYTYIYIHIHIPLASLCRTIFNLFVLLVELEPELPPHTQVPRTCEYSLVDDSYFLFGYYSYICGKS